MIIGLKNCDIANRPRHHNGDSQKVQFLFVVPSEFVSPICLCEAFSEVSSLLNVQGQGQAVLLSTNLHLPVIVVETIHFSSPLSKTDLEVRSESKPFDIATVVCSVLSILFTCSHDFINLESN